jgi:hypothetical protein
MKEEAKEEAENASREWAGLPTIKEEKQIREQREKLKPNISEASEIIQFYLDNFDGNFDFSIGNEIDRSNKDPNIDFPIKVRRDSWPYFDYFVKQEIFKVINNEEVPKNPFYSTKTYDLTEKGRLYYKPCFGFKFANLKIETIKENKELDDFIKDIKDIYYYDITYSLKLLPFFEDLPSSLYKHQIETAINNQNKKITTIKLKTKINNDSDSIKLGKCEIKLDEFNKWNLIVAIDQSITNQ